MHDITSPWDDMTMHDMSWLAWHGHGHVLPAPSNPQRPFHKWAQPPNYYTHTLYFTPKAFKVTIFNRIQKDIWFQCILDLRKKGFKVNFGIEIALVLLDALIYRRAWARRWRVWSSVVSVLISVTTDMTSTEVRYGTTRANSIPNWTLNPFFPEV